jgi:rod shape determining protein RodA
MKEQILRFLKRYDFSFFLITFAIFFIGILNLYSATHSAKSSSLQQLYQTQLGWYTLAIIIGFIISFFTPRFWYRFSYIFYIVNVCLLVGVIVFGKVSLGAQRWLHLGGLRFQPSELMKVALILSLARWFSKNNPDKEMALKDLLLPFIITLIPMLLIIVQPDLGTGLVLLLIFFSICFYRQLKWKSIIILIMVCLVGGSVMYKFGLKDYQRKRIITFLDPYADARGSGYNAIQSEIAIGSGQLFGKGFKKSTQASLNYLPENHTDFVFSIFNEEHGFFGSLVLMILYLILFFRFIWLSSSSLKFYDAIVSIGLMSLIFWHTLINMGMVMGLMPIVGLPLPFMSYGGSSLLTFGVAIGIVTSLSNSRNIF